MKPNGHGMGSGRAAGCGRAAVNGRARIALDRTIRAGAATYDRARDLPALVRLDPWVKIADTVEAVGVIVARLERALRSERSRARSGHWTYDLNRHIALRQAYLAETRRLAALEAERR